MQCILLDLHLFELISKLTRSSGIGAVKFGGKVADFGGGGPVLMGGALKCKFSIMTERDFANLSDTCDLSPDLGPCTRPPVTTGNSDLFSLSAGGDLAGLLLPLLCK